MSNSQPSSSVQAQSTGRITPSTTAYSADMNNENTSGVNGGENAHNEKSGESSKNAMGNDRIDPKIYNHSVNLTNWIFNVGYLHQDWADLHLTFFQSGLKVHRIILARSPYLANIMRNVNPGSAIHLNFVDENINQESVHITLQYLYNPSHNLINPSNARSILATAYLFGGMPELIHHSYEIIKSSIDSKNVIDNIRWLSQPSDVNGFRIGNGNGNINGNSNGNGNGSSSTMFGTVDSSENQNHQNGIHDNWVENENRYGEWTARLKNDIINYLLHQLPSQHPSDLTSNSEVISIFSKLPYSIFKNLLESKELPINSMQERFSFTKKIITQRKKLNGTGGPGGMEESVVLAFKGNENGMEIHISRKPKKSRALWKVES